jgi:hypothetical protein
MGLKDKSGNRYQKGVYAGPPEIHHQTKNGFTVSQDHTVCLCSWHHRGICLPAYTSSGMLATFGPSLAKGSKRFFEQYGTNEEQMEFQNKLIGDI